MKLTTLDHQGNIVGIEVEETEGVVMLNPQGKRELVDSEQHEALEAAGYTYHTPRCRVCGEVVHNTASTLTGTYAHQACDPFASDMKDKARD